MHTTRLITRWAWLALVAAAVAGCDDEGSSGTPDGGAGGMAGGGGVAGAGGMAGGGGVAGGEGGMAGGAQGRGELIVK